MKHCQTTVSLLTTCLLSASTLCSAAVENILQGNPSFEIRKDGQPEHIHISGGKLESITDAVHGKYAVKYTTEKGRAFFPRFPVLIVILLLFVQSLRSKGDHLPADFPYCIRVFDGKKLFTHRPILFQERERMDIRVIHLITLFLVIIHVCSQVGQRGAVMHRGIPLIFE